jgi:hypothetical protein
VEGGQVEVVKDRSDKSWLFKLNVTILCGSNVNTKEILDLTFLPDEVVLAECSQDRCDNTSSGREDKVVIDVQTDNAI